jgi:hypothetical protein
MAIIDLIAIIPSFIVINDAIKVVKLLRLIRTIRVIRVFKAVRYSKNFNLIIRIFKSQKAPLTAVFGIAVVALPAGFITASMMDEIRKMHSLETNEDPANADEEKRRV